MFSPPTLTKAGFIAFVVSAIVSPIVAVVTTHLVNRNFPLPQLVQTVEKPETFHLPKLRPNVAHLVYSFIHTGWGQRTTPRLLGVSTKPACIYELRIANVTKVAVGAVDVVLSIPAEEAGIRSLHSPLRLADGTTRDPGQWLFTSAKGASTRLYATLPRLPSGQAYVCTIALMVRERPVDASIGLDIHCSEGPFVPLTPAQWDAIGWNTK